MKKGLPVAQFKHPINALMMKDELLLMAVENLMFCTFLLMDGNAVTSVVYIEACTVQRLVTLPL